MALTRQRLLDLNTMLLLCSLTASAQGGAWSSWSSWQCNSNSSSALRQRRYVCGANETTNCSTVDTQVQSSPIAFDWSSWSAWVPSCNTTSQTRTRSCVVPRINFDLSAIAVCFNCGNQSRVDTQLQTVPFTPCCQVMYQWSQWVQWPGATCSNPANRSRECVLSSASTAGDMTGCETCQPLSSQVQLPGDFSLVDLCAPSSSSDVLLPILLSLLLLTLVCGVLGITFFALCLREVKLHRQYEMRNREQQTRRPRLNFRSWQEEAVLPSNDFTEMLPRDNSTHRFDVNPSENKRNPLYDDTEAMQTGEEEQTKEDSTVTLESTQDIVPTQAWLARGRKPTRAKQPSEEENLYNVVSDVKSLVHKDLAESGEGIEMASINSPLYEPSDDEESTAEEDEEITVI